MNHLLLGQMQQIGCIPYLLKLSSSFGSKKEGLQYRMVGRSVSHIFSRCYMEMKVRTIIILQLVSPCPLAVTNFQGLSSFQRTN